MLMPTPVNSKPAGFTLLEVLLALVIFAILSLSAYAVLQGVLRNDEVSRAKIARLSELQRAMTTLSRDFTQPLPRPSRMDGENSAAVFESQPAQLESEDGAVLFIRAGWLNPGGILRRSELQKVGYRLSNQTLERLTWLYPDAVTGTQPAAVEISLTLTDYGTIRRRFLLPTINTTANGGNN